VSTALYTLVGIALIVVTMRDVVHELFHPEWRGSISRQVMNGIWRVMHGVARIRRRWIHHAGPFILLAVANAWMILLVAGWALVYLPHLPEGFVPAPGLPVGQERGFFTAVYVSLGSLTTLSSSDLTPARVGLRLATTLESVVGLVVFTAWITWVLSLYPVLADRRAFTRAVELLRRVYPDPAALLDEADRVSTPETLRSLTEQLVQISARLQQSPVSYYFQSESQPLALGAQLPWVLRLAEHARNHAADAAIRHQGKLLRLAVESLLDEIGDMFLGLTHPDPHTALAALARDHLLDPPTFVAND
jgi:hypothetical protein